MANSRLSFLFNKYLQGQLTEADAREWHLLLQDEKNQAELSALVDQSYMDLSEAELKDLAEPEQMYQHIVQQGKTRRLWPRFAAAASILIALSTGIYYFMQSSVQTAQLVQNTNQIVPGGNKAILTLANGQKIDLTAAKSGKIASEQQAAINKTGDGQLAYQSANGNDTQVQYNTLSTPIGGRYELTLADGTKVTLDAESSITYPVAFTGNDRKVKITGQAYFTVKHDAQHPFSVETSASTIRDIGTEFNVNTYRDDEAEKTTLIEGAVSVNDKNLIPGQQAQVIGDKTKIRKADLESVTAWKENNFMFRGQSLRITMQQIARWYNVSVKYEVDPDQIRIGGGISRTRQLNAVLDLMTGTGLVKFKVKERTITVYQ